LSHQRKRKKKEKNKKKRESGDSFVNVYLRLWLTCQLLLEALLIANLRNELNTHLALQALLI
jgi:hypothetical protein